ncbi:hypothetical protein [Trichothermofontia sp.]
MQLYLGIHQRQLRFFSQSGNLLPTPEGVAEAEQQYSERLST